MIEQGWIVEARKYIGTKEVPGVKHSPLILSWWKKIKRGGIKSDEVPWCAAFVGAMLEESGLVSSRFESAKSYLTWGERLSKPLYGCIVVFARNSGGHVGFVVGKDATGRLMVLGGNQGDKVSVVPFSVDRVAGYRWPKAALFTGAELPLLASTAAASTNEA